MCYDGASLRSVRANEPQHFQLSSRKSYHTARHVHKSHAHTRAACTTGQPACWHQNVTWAIVWYADSCREVSVLCDSAASFTVAKSDGMTHCLLPRCLPPPDGSPMLCDNTLRNSLIHRADGTLTSLQKPEDGCQVTEACKYFSPNQTRSATHPLSLQWIPCVTRPRAELNTHFHSMPTLRMRGVTLPEIEGSEPTVWYLDSQGLCKWG